jgi:uncharacterized membrane-anchored protein
MIFLILYAVAMLALLGWAVEWCLWHACLAISRFFKTHKRKRPA